MLELLSISGLVNAITALGFGSVVFLKNWRDFGNRLFFLMTLSLAVWGFAYWQWLAELHSQSVALFWVHILAAASVLIPIFFFHWVVVLLGRVEKFRTLILILYASAIVIVFLSPTNLVVDGLRPKLFFPFWPDPGIAYTFYIFTLYVGSIIFSLYLLISEFTQPKSILRGQTFYIIIGAVCGFGGGFTDFFLWYNIPIPPYGNFLVAAFPFLLAYAVIKHHLFNLKAIAAELLVIFISIILLIEAGLSKTSLELSLRIGFFVLVAGLGYLLIRSVYNEVEQRELIQKQEQELEVVNKQQEGLLHFISHEVKGYLTKNEAGFAAITEGDYGAVSEPLKTMAASALVDTRRGVETVMDILDASNLKKGTVEYDKKKFDFSSAVQDIVNSLKPMAQEKGISLEYTNNAGGASTIDGDENKLRRHVIRNLIDNSIRYTPSGSVRVEISKTDNALRMTVTDTGVGITPEDMTRLFKEGGHGSDSIKVNVHSTGYGLYIAKSIVEAHGGKIWAESEGAGKGSRFIVELPVA